MTIVQPTIKAPAVTKNPHLGFLDGIRGLAALYVVFHHTWLESGTSMPPALHTALGYFLFHGRFAVAIFIVLSGYVLMLPVARSQDRYLPKGILDYFRRRARRIIPPYLAALAVAIALILLGRAVHLPPYHLDVLTPATVISHLFLVHNLSLDWFFAIDAPMWSVATEWQIYFVFALVLLPIWRKSGTVVTTIAAFTLGMSPFLLSKLGLPTFYWASPWLLGLFGFGIFAACAEWSDHPSDQKLRLPWLAIAILGLIIYIAVYIFQPLWSTQRVSLLGHAWSLNTLALIAMDIFAGVTAVGLIGYLADLAHQGAKPNFVMRLFQSRFASFFAGFSYSLYLMHMPILSLLSSWFGLYLTGLPLTIAIWAIALPLAIGFSWLLYWVVERKPPRPINGEPGHS